MKASAAAESGSRWDPVARPTDLGRLRATWPGAWLVSRTAGAISGGGRIDVVDVMGYAPALFWCWLPLALRVVPLSTLSRAHVELVTLRTAWVVRASYEWDHDIYISRLNGLSADDVERVALGPDAPGWGERQRLILRAVDELLAERMITPSTRAQLEAHLRYRQIADLCMLVGLYAMLAMLIKTHGLTIEPDAWQRGPLRRLRRAADRERLLSTAIEHRVGAASADHRPSPTEVGPYPRTGYTRTPGANTIDRICGDPRWDRGARRPAELGRLRHSEPGAWLLSRLAGALAGSGRIQVIDAFAMSFGLLVAYLPLGIRIALTSVHQMDRELVTQRTVWNTKCRYEWFYHAHVSRLFGFSPETVERVTRGADAPGWTERQRLLLTATDQLHATWMIEPATLAGLRRYLSAAQIADMCMLIGHYEMHNMMFNTFGCEPEDTAFRRGPFAWLRRDDDSDRLWRRRPGRVTRMLLPHAMIDDVVPVTSYIRGGLLAIPLTRGDRAVWVRAVLDRGTGTVTSRNRQLTFSNPRVIDGLAARDLDLPFGATASSRLVKLLIADLPKPADPQENRE